MGKAVPVDGFAWEDKDFEMVSSAVWDKVGGRESVARLWSSSCLAWDVRAVSRYDPIVIKLF